MIADVFTDLSAVAASGAPQGIQALWKATFELKEWCFLQQFGPEGQPPPGPPPIGSPMPLIVRVEHKRYVAAFTSSKRAVEAAQHSRLVHPRFGIPVLAIPTESAVTTLCKMDDGALDGVLFNQNEGQQGFFTPLASVPLMYEWNLDRLPPGEVGQWALTFARAGATGWQRFLRQLVRLPQWFMLGDRARPQSPRLAPIPDHLTGTDAICVVAFTDEAEALQGRDALGVTDEGDAPLIPAAPKGAIDFFAKLHATSGGRIAVAIFNIGGQRFPVRLPDFPGVVRAQ